MPAKLDFYLTKNNENNLYYRSFVVHFLCPRPQNQSKFQNDTEYTAKVLDVDPI